MVSCPSDVANPLIVIGGIHDTVVVGSATENPVAEPDVVCSIAEIAVAALDNAADPAPTCNTTRLPGLNCA